MESIMTNQSKTPIFTEQRYKFYFIYQLFFLQKQLNTQEIPILMASTECAQSMPLYWEVYNLHPPYCLLRINVYAMLVFTSVSLNSHNSLIAE